MTDRHDRPEDHPASPEMPAEQLVKVQAQIIAGHIVTIYKQRQRIEEMEAKMAEACDLIWAAYQALGRLMEHWTDDSERMADRLSEWDCGGCKNCKE